MSLKPDLAVMQEATQSKLACNQDLWHGANPKNGIAVLAANGLKAVVGPVDATALWSIVPLKISGVRFSLHLLAVWTRFEKKYIEGLDEALGIYTEFLKAVPSVILGDFNSSAIWDNPKKDTDFSRVASRMGAEFGLKSAYHSFHNEAYGEETAATHHFRWHKDEPFHIDYCFVPSNWVVESVEVGKHNEWGSLSDHCPLVVDVSF